MSNVSCPAGTFPYVITAGDTFRSLARRFNSSMQAIAVTNPGVDSDNLEIGQVICIPMGEPPTSCPGGTFPYIVTDGDTFRSLARRFNTTVQAIAAANPEAKPYYLQVGQKICIPIT